MFVEGNATFSPAAIQSKFNRMCTPPSSPPFLRFSLLVLLMLDIVSDVFVVIRAHSTPEDAFYQLEIATLDGVPTFGPSLSTSYNPSNNSQFRELLFTKSKKW